MQDMKKFLSNNNILGSNLANIDKKLEKAKNILNNTPLIDLKNNLRLVDNESMLTLLYSYKENDTYNELFEFNYSSILLTKDVYYSLLSNDGDFMKLLKNIVYANYYYELLKLNNFSFGNKSKNSTVSAYYYSYLDYIIGLNNVFLNIVMP